jgi:hypothetical protein
MVDLIPRGDRHRGALLLLAVEQFTRRPGLPAAAAACADHRCASQQNSPTDVCSRSIASFVA